MQQDRPLLGIGLMLGFSSLAPLADAMTKLLGGLVPVVLFLFYRFLIQSLILTPIAARSGTIWHLTPKLVGLIVIRTVFHLLGVFAVFMGLRVLPLADALAIAFVMPFISLLLGKFFLSEEVGTRRLASCFVGFIGVLLVIQPSFLEVGLSALWPLFTALNFALFMLVGRSLAKVADPVAIQMISGYCATLIMTPIMLYNALQPDTGFAIVPNNTDAILLLLGMGTIGTVAHLFMTWSLRYAPSTTLAPLTYIEIPITTLVGFLIFGDLPNGLAAIGILITMGAGLYIVFREQAMSQAQPTAH